MQPQALKRGMLFAPISARKCEDMKRDGFAALMANIDLRTDQSQPTVVTNDQRLFMRTLAMFLRVTA